MPTLLPRESMDATSVIPASIQRPSPYVHRVGFSNSFTRLGVGSLALRPAPLLFGNSRPRVTTTPLPHTTGAHGQLPGRDFNPLDLLLLLRTVRLDLIRSSCPDTPFWGLVQRCPNSNFLSSDFCGTLMFFYRSSDFIHQCKQNTRNDKRHMYPYHPCHLCVIQTLRTR